MNAGGDYTHTHSLVTVNIIHQFRYKHNSSFIHLLFIYYARTLVVHVLLYTIYTNHGLNVNKRTLARSLRLKIKTKKKTVCIYRQFNDRIYTWNISMKKIGLFFVCVDAAIMQQCIMNENTFK